MAGFSALAFSSFSCFKPESSAGPGYRGWGRGRREPETEMTTRRVSRREGEAEERKVDFAAQCQDPKNNNPVFLLSEWGIFFLSWQTVDGACLAAEISLALLQECFLCTAVGSTRFRTNGMLVRPRKVACRTRVVLDSYDHCGLACFCRYAGLRKGE